MIKKRRNLLIAKNQKTKFAKQKKELEKKLTIVFPQLPTSKLS